MLALEYILIDISLIGCIPKLRDQLYEYNRALEYTLSFLSLSRLSSGQAQRHPEVSGPG